MHNIYIRLGAQRLHVWGGRGLCDGGTFLNPVRTRQALVAIIAGVPYLQAGIVYVPRFVITDRAVCYF